MFSFYFRQTCQIKLKKQYYSFHNHANFWNFNFHGSILFFQLHKRLALSCVRFLCSTFLGFLLSFLIKGHELTFFGQSLKDLNNQGQVVVFPTNIFSFVPSDLTRLLLNQKSEPGYFWLLIICVHSTFLNTISSKISVTFCNVRDVTYLHLFLNLSNFILISHGPVWYKCHQIKVNFSCTVSVFRRKLF